MMSNAQRLAFLAVALLITADANAQGHGRRGHGRGGRGRDAAFVADRDAFHFLLEHHESITRAVTDLPNGVTTVTESSDPQVVSILRDHVRAMARRIKQNDPVRRRDPLFDEIFQHADRIRIKHADTPNGIRVTTTSQDPYAARLIQAHAQVLSLFVQKGLAEARENHAPPDATGPVCLDPRAIAEAARAEMFAGLIRRMQAGAKTGGPEGSIAVCRDEAPQVAREVADRFGVRIGRTALRLRNPANRPPAWATTAVQQRIDQPHWVERPDGQLGALLPIQLAAGCVQCHGDPQRIPEKIGAALASHYPEDQATGFSEGDLRGWFWIEVPPDAHLPD